MAEEEPTTVEQIAEYESQLAEIVELLEASPGDESILALKKDLEEVLELSRQNIIAQTTNSTTTAGASTKVENSLEDRDLRLPPPPPLPPPPIETDNGITDGGASSTNAAVSASSSTTQLQHEASSSLSLSSYNQTIPIEGVSANSSSESAAKKEKPHKAKKSGIGSKKPKKVKDFVMPDHLIPNDEDTETERNKKRRAAKSLKNKWRLQKKEIQSDNRQKSWQSFQKKSHSASSTSGSIFATKEGVNDRVGVVSKKQLTDFGARKRHK
uniref:Uncharacterized protein n=1 Tax=Pseudo-nitzschia australis TaxID=44445 RepID=A0A7S4AT14_9STRA|mmetsp:Transcript_11819/g.24985  ORF Transcript_11819/g.24985 Transcript_11819/m.24985 type:complete len:269 (+) Transcript_11819:151-957(+)|eukprot:CAMPEP_0168189650 /NCGR_PEP_ID=MMETSP0139_2-20121125/16479_1 /TAXON_ID=44445 /ORGANISM="Pseudo-nitzschia australis, Strain 10249 10 AB" /LENGTH=268 /DNA_ID=CAMNT_0008112539 /DNA_START=42 /DNA_END=848 /DNA_ORIENTATION=-